MEALRRARRAVEVRAARPRRRRDAVLAPLGLAVKTRSVSVRSRCGQPDASLPLLHRDADSVSMGGPCACPACTRLLREDAQGDSQSRNEFPRAINIRDTANESRALQVRQAHPHHLLEVLVGREVEHLEHPCFGGGMGRRGSVGKEAEAGEECRRGAGGVAEKGGMSRAEVGSRLGRTNGYDCGCDREGGGGGDGGDDGGDYASNSKFSSSSSPDSDADSDSTPIPATAPATTTPAGGTAAMRFVPLWHWVGVKAGLVGRAAEAGLGKEGGRRRGGGAAAAARKETERKASAGPRGGRAAPHPSVPPFWPAAARGAARALRRRACPPVCSPVVHLPVPSFVCSFAR
eukprot:gene540-biopygen4757